MLRNGFKNLWKKIIEVENLDVRFNVDIYRLYRSRSQNKLWIDMKTGSGSRGFQEYDFLIWSPEMKTSLPIWADATDEEIYYFSRPSPAFFTTALVDTVNMTRATSPIDYWFDNINKKRQHSLWAQRDSYASLANLHGEAYRLGQYPGGEDGLLMKTAVTYQMGDSAPIYTELRHKLMESLTELHASSVNVGFMKTWRYFPRFSGRDLEEGMLWRILEMQGKYGTWYIGSSVSFESVKSVVEYNKLLLKHYTIPTQ